VATKILAVAIATAAVLIFAVPFFQEGAAFLFFDDGKEQLWKHV